MKFRNYSKKAYSSRLGLLLIDSISSVCTLFFAAWLRTSFNVKDALFLFHGVWPIVLSIRLIMFRTFRTYSVVVKYSGISNLLQVFNAVSLGSIVSLAIILILRTQGIILSRSVVIIDFFILTFVLSAIRLIIPFILNRNNPKPKESIAIIGSGKAGLLTKEWITKYTSFQYVVAVFIDDNPDAVNKRLDGIPIVHPRYIENYKVQKAVYAIEQKDYIIDHKLIEELLEKGIQILKFHVDNPQPFYQENLIDIEDLLGRPPILNLDLEKENVYAGKTILITGAAGSIGSEIVRQLIPFKPGKLVLVDQAESPLVSMELECKETHFFTSVKAYLADITDKYKISNIFFEELPHIIFHAAAYKHVPIIEEFPEEAIKTNILGSKILADLANDFKVKKFILVSTDKAVNPTNVMGASKRIAEIYCQSLNKISSTEFITTRFGNVLGSTGSVILRFREQIRKGGPVTVTHPEVMRYFMTIPEASLLVIEAGELGKGGEIFLFDMGNPIKIDDLAKKMIQLSGKEVSIIYTGLRSGEKLFEELLVSQENTIKTIHPKLTIARVIETNFSEIQEKITHLLDSLSKKDSMEMVKIMKSMVNEFKSENSPFQKLD
jgi:FlaA1/EpsC-like NDP-sugar epimerase